MKWIYDIISLWELYVPFSPFCFLKRFELTYEYHPVTVWISYQEIKELIKFKNFLVFIDYKLASLWNL